LLVLEPTMQSGQRRANCRRTGDCRDKRGEEEGRRKEEEEVSSKEEVERYHGLLSEVWERGSVDRLLGGLDWSLRASFWGSVVFGLAHY
jgi:hypothetical protein